MTVQTTNQYTQSQRRPLSIHYDHRHLIMSVHNVDNPSVWLTRQLNNKPLSQKQQMQISGRLTHPKVLLSVLQTAEVRIFRFFGGVFFADAPPISQTEAVSKVNFSTIHLSEQCELTFSIIQRLYTWTTLFFFTSAKVLLDRRPQNIFFKNNAQCAFLADADASFLERLLSSQS